MVHKITALLIPTLEPKTGWPGPRRCSGISKWQWKVAMSVATFTNNIMKIILWCLYASVCVYTCITLSMFLSLSLSLSLCVCVCVCVCVSVCLSVYLHCSVLEHELWAWLCPVPLLNSWVCLWVKLKLNSSESLVPTSRSIVKSHLQMQVFFLAPSGTSLLSTYGSSVNLRLLWQLVGTG